VSLLRLYWTRIANHTFDFDQMKQIVRIFRNRENSK